MWEGGIRVPALIRWPGRMPRGKVSGQVGITMDLTASILAAAGARAPADARLEGINLFPILEGQAPQVERTLFWRIDQSTTRGPFAAETGSSWSTATTRSSSTFEPIPVNART